MKRVISTIPIIIFLFSIPLLASTNITIEQNEFGDSILVVDNKCNKEELIQAIERQDHSFFIKLPYQKAHFVDMLVNQYNFTFYKEIDVELPDPFTCKSGTNVLLTKQENGILYALFTIERGKNYATWPGGMLRTGERMRITGLRECKEELNIEVDSNKMVFLGVLHKTGEKFGATMHATPNG